METKLVLETLVRDEHKRVANQALVRYLSHFVNIDKTLFKPELYVPGRFPLADLPDDEPSSVLVDYCLGRRDIPRKGGSMHDDHSRVVIHRQWRRDPTQLAL